MKIRSLFGKSKKVKKTANPVNEVLELTIDSKVTLSSFDIKEKYSFDNR